MVLRPGDGEKSSERKAAFSPSPGPLPLFWPRLSGKKMPAAFSTYFPLRIRDIRPMTQKLAGTMQMTGLADNPPPLLLRAIAFHFIHALSLETHCNDSSDQSPNSHSIFRNTSQQESNAVRHYNYTSVSKRLGVLHIPIKIGTRQGSVLIKSVLWVDGDGAPGKGQRANRNALAPSPGLKAM